MTLEANSRGGEQGHPVLVLLPLLAMTPAVEQPRAPSDVENPILLAPRGARQRACRHELKASVLPSPASPLRPDKATFLRRVPLADNVGTRGGGRGATGGSITGAGGGGLGAGLGGLDGWPRR
jgi:hypothetical protein